MTIVAIEWGRHSQYVPVNETMLFTHFIVYFVVIVVFNGHMSNVVYTVTIVASHL